MKNFLKIVLASAIGAIIALTVLFIYGISSLTGSLIETSSNRFSGEVPQNAILDIDLNLIRLGEQTVEPNPFENFGLGTSGISEEEVINLGILDAVRAIKTAAEDPCVRMIYLRPDAVGSISYAEELREALLRFHDSGKPVVCWMESPTNAGCYLGSVADRVFIASDKGGIYSLVGLNGQLVFLKDLLDRLGVNVQLIRHGKYKAAGEMFICSTPSAENLEQNRAMINGMWGEMTGAMAGRCSLSVGEFNSLVDNLAFGTADDFVKYGIADEALSHLQMKERITSLSGNENYEKAQKNSILLSDYASARLGGETGKDKIAVVFADGEMIDDIAMNAVCGKQFAAMLGSIAADKDTKAVVLRVNSPGGSVTAAERIKEAVDSLAAVKPVVASFGNYAASGGYWIAAGCSKIFCDATSVTGSIGVFGMVPDFSGTAGKLLHVGVVSIPSNRHSDIYSTMRPLDRSEMAYMQKGIEEVYDRFTSLVSEGRHMSVAQVDALAQGRVWTGRDAVGNGLADEIGGIDDALGYAAVLGGCDDYRIENYPPTLSILEELIIAMQAKPTNELVKLAAEIKESSKVQVCARMPWAIEIK